MELGRAPIIVGRNPGCDLSIPADTQGPFRRIPLRRGRITVGRAPDNDIVINEPNVSWYHAEIRDGNPPTIADLGSRNGVRLANQLLQGTSQLPPGGSAGIGPF